MPWILFTSQALLVFLAAAVLALAGVVGFLYFWIGLTLFLAVFLVSDHYADRVDRTWGEGARGESRVGAELEKLHEEGFYVFHDWDSGRGNVDHFVVGRQGVFAVETKAWTGKIEKRKGRLLRNGYNVSKDPILQARAEAKEVRRLISEATSLRPYVRAAVCFTRAEISCYRPVRGVEVVSKEGLNHAIVNRPEHYSPATVRGIAILLESRLGLRAAAGPGIQPEEPSRTQRVVNRIGRLHPSTMTLICIGAAFAATFVMPESASALFELFSILYAFLAG